MMSSSISILSEFSSKIFPLVIGHPLTANITGMNLLSEHNGKANTCHSTCILRFLTNRVSKKKTEGISNFYLLTEWRFTAPLF